ncbi:MAG: ABC transmembrane type-1 domain-containing protein [Lachnoclostridium sp.]|jgi:raffinose/stachyose/melibiose transport system permease protein
MNSKKYSISPYLFMLPAFIIYISVIIFPVLYSLYISLHTGTGIGNMKFVGLANYVSLAKDPIFWVSFKHTVMWLMLTVVLCTIVSLWLAVLLSKEFIGRTFFRAFFYFPSVISAVAVGIIWRWIYNPQLGFINQFAKALGLKFSQTWISTPKTALYALFFASLWQSIGQPMILFIAGLQSISPDVLEAADIDGAGMFQKFFRITVPLMKDTFIMVISTLFISGMKVYDIVKALTDGGPNNATQVLASYMYNQVFAYNNVGYGTAIAIVMVLMMLFVIVPYLSFTARKD